MKEIMEKYKKQIEEALNDLKTPGKRHKQIPNLLTASRLLAPLVIIPSVLTGNFVLAGLSTAAFSVTDLFDGLVARKLNVTSELGKDLDAFTDKIFAGTLMISLTIINPLYILPLIMEASISGVNIKKKLNNQNPESKLIGKIKMTALYSLLALGFLNLYINIPSALINSLFVGTLGLQAATIVEYSKKKSNENIIQEEQIEDKLEDIEIKEETEEKVKTKEKEQTMTQKYLEQYRNYRDVLLEQKDIEELKQENKKPKAKIKTNNPSTVK